MKHDFIIVQIRKYTPTKTARERLSIKKNILNTAFEWNF